jgi:hypothetical protein
MVEAPAQESLAEAISTDVTSTDAPTSSGQESTRPLPGDEESSDLLAA